MSHTPDPGALLVIPAWSTPRLPLRADPAEVADGALAAIAGTGPVASPLLEGSTHRRHRVLVFGALPSEGADVDLLARPRELATMAAWLAERGYLGLANKSSSLSGSGRSTSCPPTPGGCPPRSSSCCSTTPS